LGNPFHQLKETITAWVNGKARCFASVSLGESVMQWLPSAYGSILPMIREIRQGKIHSATKLR
jgi:hypothetical protein